MPSPGKVVINTAYSVVPVGAPDQAKGTVAPLPSQVYSAGKLPPFDPAELVTEKLPGLGGVTLAAGATNTPGDAAPVPMLFVAVIAQV